VALTHAELAVGLRRSKRTVEDWVAAGIIPQQCDTVLEAALEAMDHFARVTGVGGWIGHLRCESRRTERSLATRRSPQPPQDRDKCARASGGGPW
jgi:hypothetical protein